jgi:hypothetical protein
MEDEQKKQIADLMASAEQAGERVKSARRDFEALRESMIGLLGFEPGSQHAHLLSVQLEAAYAHGLTAGEASQTSVAFQEQQQVLERMVRHTEERDARDRERADASLALDKRRVAAIEQQARDIGKLVVLLSARTATARSAGAGPHGTNVIRAGASKASAGKRKKK